MAEIASGLQIELSLRILVAFIVGAVVGIERERRAKAAGLRTHMLVAGGSAIFTIASLTLFGGDSSGERGRVAAQIVTGVGFLGAGTIFRSGNSVSGLTTAATIWVAAALGMLAGGGAYVLALVSVTLTIIALRIPHKWLRRRHPTMTDFDDELEGED
ncbi:MAG TPA: MgtC/SapB family protein [Thermomicrobiales bacterium]|jgi:putative Mg2+ transporter-C (MgtC) family protein